MIRIKRAPRNTAKTPSKVRRRLRDAEADVAAGSIVGPFHIPLLFKWLKSTITDRKASR